MISNFCSSHMVFSRKLIARTPLALAAILLLSTTLASAQDFIVKRVADGLDSPTYVTQAPGDDNTLYITELGGAIKKLDLSTGIISPFASLDATTNFAGGLHSIAFHPDFQNNGKFYAARSLDPYGPFTKFVNRLDEYTVDGTGAVSQTRMFLEEEHVSGGNASHAVNWIGFDPTSPSSETLYVTTGDGHTPSTSPPSGSLLGKVLTFDTSEASPTGQILQSGLRNPWRASFDRETGDMFIGDVGKDAFDEIDFAKAGASGLDFGWAIREGTQPGPVEGGPQGSTINPIYEKGASSITGGYVYRGPVSELQGEYFFADFVTAQIWSGEFDRDTDPNLFDGDNLTNVVERSTEFEALIPGGGSLDFIVSFGEDNAGNLYLVNYGDNFTPSLGSGQIFMIQAVPEPSSAVILLFAAASLGLWSRQRRDGNRFAYCDQTRNPSRQKELNHG